MRSAYKALGHTIAGLVAVQAAVIAFAVMGLWSWVRDGNNLTPGQVKSDNLDSTGAIGFALHSVIGMMVIPLLAIVMLVVAFRAGIDGGTRWAGILSAGPRSGLAGLARSLRRGRRGALASLRR